MRLLPAGVARRFVVLLGMTSGLLWTAAAHAQAPTIASTTPQAVRPGETVDVTVRGANLAGTTALWTSFPAEAVLSPDVEKNGENAGQVVFRVTVPEQTPVGVQGIRVATPQGVSPLRLFVIDDLPTVAQQNGNTSPEAAQELTLPCAVEGVVASLNRHYFKFRAEAGQRISFEALARRIGSPLDPMIRLIDASGRELIYSDDAPGLSADSQLSWTFTEAGEYLLEIRDIRYQGGGNHAFRLRVGDFPCVNVPYPMGAQRGTQATLSFAGSDVEGIEPLTLTVPSDPGLQWLNVGAKRAGGQGSGFAVLAVGDAPEFTESEPNDAPEQANRVELGTSINGRFETPGDVDRFVFAAQKDQKYRFTAVTRRQGSPCDLYLRLLNANGGQIAAAEEIGGAGGTFEVTFPADGDYTLLVEDLHRRGGGEFAYRVEAQPSQPGFALAASADALNVPAGGTAFVTVTATRAGHNGPIAVAAVDLPEGVVSTPTVIGPGMNAAVLTVQSQADAAVEGFVPVRIVGTAKVGEADVEVTATVTEALKGQFNAMPFPPPVLAESVAAAVTPAPAFTLRTEPAELVFGRDKKATVKVIAERKEGYTEEITLAVTPQQNGLPGGVTAAVKPVPANANEVEIEFSGNNQAALGEFTGVLVGTLKKGNETVTQAVPGITLKVE